MRNKIINKLMNNIEKNYEQDKNKLEIIRYGLETLYILITKLVIIGIIAYIFNILLEFIIFLLIYNVIRMTSFGLHATKSWICLVFSTGIFILAPFIAKYYVFPLYSKLIIGIICTVLVFKNAPADTEKRPIIDPLRRKKYKYISTSIAITMVICGIIIPNNFLANSFILALVTQSLMISPTIYKIFGLKANNYLNYQKELLV